MHLNEQLAAYVRGKKVAFIGAGVSHKELIPQFVEMGAKVTLCDKKPNLEAFGEYGETLKQLGIGLSLGENYMDGFEGQDIIMRTPGFEFYTPALQKAHEHGAELSSEMELFFKYCPCEKVAVTGSDGKTTTTSLIAAMFEAAGRTVHLGGNIGRALLPILGEVKPEDEAVVELSSFQLISMDQSPNVAVVTNVTPNHLDHHKDMAEYINAKRNILLWQQPPCRAVLGYENDVSRGMKADCKGEQVWFTRLHDTDNGAFLRKEDDMLCMAENGVVTPVLAHSEMKLRGLHNVENLLAAIAAVWGRVPLEAIQQVGRTFKGVEHRIEPVRRDLVQRFHRHQPHPHHCRPAQLRPEADPHRGRLRQEDPLCTSGSGDRGPREGAGSDGRHRPRDREGAGRVPRLCRGRHQGGACGHPGRGRGAGPQGFGARRRGAVQPCQRQL